VLTKSIIPIFPLSLVVFPGEVMPLHIFEERYILMINRCIEWQKLGPEQGLFGIHFAKEGNLEPVGCAVTVEKIAQKYEDGRMDILTRGVRRYRVGKVIKTETYQQMEAEFFDDFLIPPDLALRQHAVALHCKLLEVAGKHFSVPNFDSESLPSYILAHDAGLEMEQKQKLLELASETERLKELVSYYKKAIPDAVKNTELRERIHANGYFRHLKSIEV
jgi:Lon protease-like protein